VILFVGGPPKGREILVKRMGKNGFGSNPVGADKVGLGSLISGWTEFAVMEGIGSFLFLYFSKTFFIEIYF